MEHKGHVRTPLQPDVSLAIPVVADIVCPRGIAAHHQHHLFVAQRLILQMDGEARFVDDHQITGPCLYLIDQLLGVPLSQPDLRLGKAPVKGRDAGGNDMASPAYRHGQPQQTATGLINTVHSRHHFFPLVQQLFPLSDQYFPLRSQSNLSAFHMEKHHIQPLLQML